MIHVHTILSILKGRQHGSGNKGNTPNTTFPSLSHFLSDYGIHTNLVTVQLAPRCLYLCRGTVANVYARPCYISHYGTITYTGITVTPYTHTHALCVSLRPSPPTHEASVLLMEETGRRKKRAVIETCGVTCSLV